MSSFADILKEAAPALIPPKRLTLSEWSDLYARLSAESSAEPGKWTTLSYQRGIMDAVTDPQVEWVVVLKSARVGYTKIINNAIGYHIHQDPCPIMVVQPTVDDAEGYSKEEIASMIRDTPALQGLVSEAKAKNGQNTILAKSYPGGTLSMVGANSPRGFRRVSRRIVFFDEVDGYPVAGAGSEGDQIKLGAKRTEYYWNRKLVAGSTPTDEGISKIAKMFEDTDQRRYFVPCPHCGEMQFLKWGGKDKAYGIKWPEGKPDEAYYLCEHNGCIIEHESKVWMLERGEWRATAEPKTVGPAKRLKAGFHIWAAYSYSPNATWGHLASEFLEAKDYPLKLKTFVNTALGETWKTIGEVRDASQIKQREEDYVKTYGAQVPADIAVLTAAGDVQKGRIEVGLKGWTPTGESYLIDYQIFYGDPSQKNDEVWDLVDEWRMRKWRRADGVDLTPPLLVLDSGNGQDEYLEALYNYVLHRQGSSPRVFAIKGVPRHANNSMVHAATAKRSTVRLYTVATHAIKHMVSKRLDIQSPGPGYMHFPEGLDDEYYKQIASEKWVTEIDPRTGVTSGEWIKVYNRNEAWDVEVYNVACLSILQSIAPQLYGDLANTLQMTKGMQAQQPRGRRVMSSLR